MTSKKLFWIELASGELWVGLETADLTGGFINGYLDIGHSDREAARRAYARSVSQDVQRQLFAKALADGTVNLATIPDSAVDRLLGYADPDDNSPWDLDAVPLIVLGGRSDG